MGRTNDYIQTPWALLAITSDARGIVSADFVKTGSEAPPATHDVDASPIRAQILSYLANPKTRFTLALHVEGTVFQRKVWQALREIPAGETMTYGELAKRLKTSPRAIGNACRANPIPLIIPCHRIVSSGGIGGYSGEVAGENIDLKRQLLRHEGLSV